MAQRTNFEPEHFVKVRDSLFENKDQFSFPTKEKIQGYCWAGAVVTAYAFHAGEFDSQSEDNCDNRWENFVSTNQRSLVLNPLFRNAKLRRKDSSIPESLRQCLEMQFMDLLNLKIFIQLLELHQHQEYYAEFFSSGNCPGRTDFKTLMQWLAPVILDAHGGLDIARVYSNICNKNEIKTFFSQIQSQFDKANLSHRISFIITTCTHAIKIGYTPNDKQWRIFDIRKGNKVVNNIIELVELIAEYFDCKDDQNSIELEMYLLTIGNYKNKLLQVLNDLELKSSWIAWQEVTPEKVNRSSVNKVQWISSAMRAGDAPKVKELLNQNQFETPFILLVSGYIDLAREMLIFLAEKEKKEKEENGFLWNRNIMVRFYGEEISKSLIEWVVEFAFDYRLKKLSWLDLLIELQLEKVLEFAIQKNDLAIIKHIFLNPTSLNAMLDFAYHKAIDSKILKWLVKILDGNYLYQILDWAIANKHENTILIYFQCYNGFEKLSQANLKDTEVAKIRHVMKANQFQEEMKKFFPQTKKASITDSSCFFNNSLDKANDSLGHVSVIADSLRENYGATKPF